MLSIKVGDLSFVRIEYMHIFVVLKSRMRQ